MHASAKIFAVIGYDAFASGDIFQLFVAQCQSLSGMIFEPVRFADVESGFFSNRYCGIKIRSDLQFVLEVTIFLKLGQQILELQF